MFTGLITAIGSAERLDEAHYRFSCPRGWLANTAIGDSIAVNGACLTVTGVDAEHFDCNISEETRRCCAPLVCGARVNLEQALAVGDKLGGHIVTGHIDGTAQVAAVSADNNGGITMRLTPPPALAPLIAVKGSVALTGVSLTVNRLCQNDFEVYLLAHTLAHTNLSDATVGSVINIETDILARHVARLVSG